MLDGTQVSDPVVADIVEQWAQITSPAVLDISWVDTHRYAEN